MTSLFIICQWEGLVGEVDYRVKKRGTSSAVDLWYSENSLL